MTTIRIQEKSKNENNIIIMDVVQLDGDTFFHVHGLIEGKRVDQVVNITETDYPAQRAQELFYFHADNI